MAHYCVSSFRSFVRLPIIIGSAAAIVVIWTKGKNVRIKVSAWVNIQWHNERRDDPKTTDYKSFVRCTPRQADANTDFDVRKFKLLRCVNRENNGLRLVRSPHPPQVHSTVNIPILLIVLFYKYKIWFYGWFGDDKILSVLVVVVVVINSWSLPIFSSSFVSSRRMTVSGCVEIHSSGIHEFLFVQSSKSEEKVKKKVWAERCGKKGIR